MAQYHGPPGSKKRRQLERREADLVRALRGAADESGLAEAAESLRLAALAYFEAIGEADSTRVQNWRNRSTASILDSYRGQAIP